VERAGNAGAFQRLPGAQFLADRHQARHLDLGHLDLFAAPVGQANVDYVKILGGGRHDKFRFG
jgi:hypothetical protein